TTCSFNVTISAYCTIPSTGTQNYIHKFVFNGVENTSGNNGGYANFTNISTNVTPGQTLVVSLIPGSAGGFNVMGFWRIWIDYNRDGDFTDVGELVLQQSGVGPLVGLFTVPAQMTPGPTRMRVYMNRFAFPNPCDHH